MTAAGAIHIIKTQARLTPESKTGPNRAYGRSPVPYGRPAPIRYGKWWQNDETENNPDRKTESRIYTDGNADRCGDHRRAGGRRDPDLQLTASQSARRNRRSYYAQLQYEFMETGEINDKYLNDFYFPTSPPGRTSFKLSGQEITLKEGSIAVRSDPVRGYAVLYYCNDYRNELHNECQLLLPMS